MKTVRFASLMALLIYIMALPLPAASAAAASTVADIDSLTAALDEAVARRGEYRQAREAALAALADSCAAARGDDGRLFYFLGELGDKYMGYDTDSAFAVYARREAVAVRMANSDNLAAARMNIANAMAASGMYKEALDEVDAIDGGALPAYLRPFYFHIYRTVYGLMADYAVRPSDQQRYAALTDSYRDSLLAANVANEFPYTLILGDKLNHHGRHGEAIALINNYMAERDISVHDRAMFAFTLSEAYHALGDTLGEKRQLLISAIADMQFANREYISLRKLAVLLYNEGNVADAYRFLSICMEDAIESNARLRQIEINDIFPIVNEVYVDTIRQQRQAQRRLSGALGLLSLLLVAAILIVYKQKRRVAAAHRQIEEANARLHALNDELKQYNAQLRDANRAIAENSYLKEEYIGRYMDLCSLYIEKLDKYRKSLDKLAKAGKLDELRQSLRSTDHLEAELKDFYYVFDTSFLELFPTFVDDFNKLLLPGEAVLPKQRGRLNTELRIFALIRLGITDSAKIASFLRYSITTIYNYRTKIRNKASGDRDQLEARVMAIGTSAV